MSALESAHASERLRGAKGSCQAEINIEHQQCSPGPSAPYSWVASHAMLGCICLLVMQVQQVVHCRISHKSALHVLNQTPACAEEPAKRRSHCYPNTADEIGWCHSRICTASFIQPGGSVGATWPSLADRHPFQASPGPGLQNTEESKEPHTTLAPGAPSAGAAAASHICFGRLLPALYLKLGTFLPSPFSVISPLPPLPDLQSRKEVGLVCACHTGQNAWLLST